MAKVSEVMVNQVISVNKNESIKTVLRAFVEHRISGVPIINSKNEPVGFISDGDIMKNIGHRDPKIFFFDVMHSATWVDKETFEEKIRNIMDLNVMEIATTRVITVDSDQDIDQVAKILGNKKIKKVPVIVNNKLIGIISRGDIVRFVVKNYLDSNNL